MCEIADPEPCEVWDERPVVARKEHQCTCCRSPIHAGETYLRHFSVFEGAVETGKLCPACKADREAFSAAHHGVLYTPGIFPLQLSDCIADGDEESELRWKPMLERIVTSREAAKEGL